MILNRFVKYFDNLKNSRKQTLEEEFDKLCLNGKQIQLPRQKLLNLHCIKQCPKSPLSIEVFMKIFKDNEPDLFHQAYNKVEISYINEYNAYLCLTPPLYRIYDYERIMRYK